MSPIAADVLVVGAGPVGLVAAAELARRGVAVRIVDKLTEPTTESRAIAVHARSLDMLSRMGIADELIATGVKARGMELYSHSGKLVRVPLESADSAYPFCLNTPQTETERVLTTHLAALGVKVERGVELIGLTQDAQEVRARLRQPDGTEEDSVVSWVVGADGAHSTVRHLVGGKLAGIFVGERFLLGDVDAEHTLDTETMYTFFAPGGTVLVMPMRDGRTRVMPQIHDEPGTPLNLHPTLDRLQQILDERVGGIRLTKAHWLTAFELHHAQVNRYRWDRVFLLGDTAHIHSPAGGQGMNTGMQDAFNLSWKLAAVVNGSAAPALLDSYHAERHPVADSMITFTRRLSRVGTLTGVPERIRNGTLKLLSHVRPIPRLMARTTAGVAINYRHSPIVVSRAPRGAKIVAGDHFPNVANRDLQKRITECWGAEHTTVTVTVGRPAPAPGPGGQQVLVCDNDIPVNGYDVVIADPQRILGRRLGLMSGGRVVVRPDGYVGAISGHRDSRNVADYFTALAG